MTTSVRDALADRYRIEREIGRGAMATVYLARDLRQGRQVAIKVLHQEHTTTHIAERFLREVRTAANLQHPNILPLYDSGEADGILYYTMPYVAGESLADRLKARGPLPVGEAVRIASEVADALSYAHRLGVIHRDIKPANILLAGGDHATVADFGLVALAHAATNLRLTGVGMGVGSPHYMSPEQALGEGEPTGKADVYSLGCMLYEMLTGRPPFEGDSVQAVWHQHLHAEPPPLENLQSEGDAALGDLIAAQMAKDAESRPTAEAVRSSLHRFAASHLASGRADSDQPITAPGKSQRLSNNRLRKVSSGRTIPLQWTGLFLVVLLAIGALTMWWRAGAARTSEASINVSLLPLTGSSADSTRSETLRSLLFSAMRVAQPVRAFDGRELLQDEGEWRAIPLTTLLRRARAAGSDYLIAGDISPDEALALELYDVPSGRMIGSGASARGESAPQAMQRIALEFLRVLADRNGFTIGTPSYLIAATSSTAALEHFIAARDRFWADDIDAAVAGFARSIQADPAFGPAYFYKSAAETWRSDYPAARRAAEEGMAHREQMEPIWARLLAAQRHYVMRNGAASTEAFQRMVAEEPWLVEAFWGLGESLLHFGGFLGSDPHDAIGPFERLIAIDSSFAPVYVHLTELAIETRDSVRAVKYLPRVRSSDSTALKLGVRTSFGTAASRASAFSDASRAERRDVSEVVLRLIDDPARADSVAGGLLAPGRTPDDRTRGAQYRLAALAAQGRWPEALRTWREAAGGSNLDPWLLHAYFAGYDAPEAERMLAWARRRIRSGTVPDITNLTSEDANAVRALVIDALLRGNQATIDELMPPVIASAANQDAWSPEPEALRYTLLARQALLAADTAAAIEHLRSALGRAPWGLSSFTPLLDAAAQRLTLATLLASQGEQSEARRWLNSFGRTRAVGDLLYQEAVSQARTLIP